MFPKIEFNWFSSIGFDQFYLRSALLLKFYFQKTISRIEFNEIQLQIQNNHKLLTSHFLVE